METDKIIGYLLLVVGIGIIIFSAFSIYQVFTGQKDAPVVFSFEAPAIKLPTQGSLQSDLLANIELPEGMELPEGLSLPDSSSESTSQEIKILPDQVINNIVNMSIHLLLMGFIVSVGTKVAGLGIKLIKDIKVVVKEEKIRPVVKAASPSSPPPTT